nr:MAG TPA: hypothetical protein [Caudoviricetes sp.]
MRCSFPASREESENTCGHAEGSGRDGLTADGENEAHRAACQRDEPVCVCCVHDAPWISLGIGSRSSGY